MNNYMQLVENIYNHGINFSDRTGVGRRKLFSQQLRFDLKDGFPLVTVKRTSFRLIAEELLWFLSGSSDVKELQAKNVHIWDDWVDEYGEVGAIYGPMWRTFPITQDVGELLSTDQIQNVETELRRNPHSSRLIVSAWHPGLHGIPGMMHKNQLVPCHVMFQLLMTEENVLSMHVTQRSADVMLGVPFNIASYALLLSMFAKSQHFYPGELVITFVDAHIYLSHMPNVTHLFGRTPYPHPYLSISHKKSVLDYSMDNFALTDYQAHPPVKFKVAV